MFDEKILTENGVNLAKSLELFGDMETYNDTLDDFLKDVEEKVTGIKKYKEISDMQNYAILVHSLKSDAKYFGFEKLAELALAHEMESKNNNMYFVTDHFDELMNETNRIIDIVKVYLGFASKEDIEQKRNNTPVEKLQNDKSILVVDDSNIISNFITKIFANEYEVIHSKDGQEAIDFLSNRSREIAGMLLDLNMPNVNGYDVLQFMKTNNLFNYVKVAIITGTDSKSIMDKLKEYPIVAVLEKPFNEANIKKVVELIAKK